MHALHHLLGEGVCLGAICHAVVLHAAVIEDDSLRVVVVCNVDGIFHGYGLIELALALHFVRVPSCRHDRCDVSFLHDHDGRVEVISNHAASHVLAMDSQGICAMCQWRAHTVLWVYAHGMGIGVHDGGGSKYLPLLVDIDLRDDLDALVACVVGKLIHRDALGCATDCKAGALGVVEGLHACDGDIHA